MTASRFLTLALSALASSTPGLCQQPLTRSAAITGTVTAWAGGTPILRARVCAFGVATRSIQCESADTAGRYLLTQIYPGIQLLQFDCETGRTTFDTRTLDTVRVTVGDGDTLVYDARVPLSGCDQRPYEVVSGEFTGHWASGFELDDFVPCTDSTKHAWVERRGLKPGELWYLRGGEPYDGGRRWFVRWRGVWVGPRNVIKPYHMVVDSVIEMRMPGPADCRT
jgi:hypothetical protein